MRFGFWPNPRSDYNATKTLAVHAEATGWDGLWLADHFLPDESIYSVFLPFFKAI